MVRIRSVTYAIDSFWIFFFICFNSRQVHSCNKAEAIFFHKNRTKLSKRSNNCNEHWKKKARKEEKKKNSNTGGLDAMGFSFQMIPRDVHYDRNSVMHPDLSCWCFCLQIIHKTINIYTEQKREWEKTIGDMMSERAGTGLHTIALFTVSNRRCLMNCFSVTDFVFRCVLAHDKNCIHANLFIIKWIRNRGNFVIVVGGGCSVFHDWIFFVLV